MMLKRRILVLIAVLGCLALLGLLASCTLSTSTHSSVPTPNLTKPVSYEVTGTASSVDVTLSDAAGSAQHYADIAVPHTFSYPSFRADFVYISAQSNEAHGSVTVSIYVNGRLFKTASSSGFTPATVSGLKSLMQ